MSDWATTRRRHGTPSGWSLHVELGERPCDPCFRAKSEYDRHRRGQPEQVLKNRQHARAQMKAYGALAHRHPDEYRELYQAFKAQTQGTAS